MPRAGGNGPASTGPAQAQATQRSVRSCPPLQLLVADGIRTAVGVWIRAITVLLVDRSQKAVDQGGDTAGVARFVWRRRSGPMRLHARPTKAAAHATSATTRTSFGSHPRASSAIAWRMRNVAAPYMPSGNTIAQ